MTPWHPIFLQLLWDLELLTGAGLGLFWPPWAQFCGLRGQAQGAGSQCSKLRRRMESAERLMREVSWSVAEGGGPVTHGVQK